MSPSSLSCYCSAYSSIVAAHSTSSLPSNCLEPISSSTSTSSQTAVLMASQAWRSVAAASSSALSGDVLVLSYWFSLLSLGSLGELLSSEEKDYRLRLPSAILAIASFTPWGSWCGRAWLSATYWSAMMRLWVMILLAQRFDTTLWDQDNVWAWQ